MKKDEVKVGSVYAAKVSDKVVPVRIDAESPHGGWVGTNQETGKQVRVKSAQRLRGLWPTKEHAKAIVAAEQENAWLAEERAASPDGMTASERAMAKVEAKGATQGNEEPEAKPKANKGKKRAPRAKEGAKERGLSGLDAAARVLEEAGEPLDCKTIVERAFEKGYWRSDGKTPAATVYAAILREIQKKGDEARFCKAARGKFELAR